MKKPLLTFSFIFSGALLLLVLVQGILIDVKTVNGPSMEPQLTTGQNILVFKAAYGLRIPIIDRYWWIWKSPEINDVLIIKNPDGNHYMIKRCLGLPGDTVEMNEGGLLIRGRLLPLDLVQGKKWTQTTQIPPGHIFLVGDNLTRSLDSRDLGFFSMEEILGKMIF